MRQWASRALQWTWNVAEWKFLTGVYLLALVCRLGFVFVAGHAPPGVDEVEYDLIARSLLEGKGYAWYRELPTAFRPPGYPFFLAFVYAIVGKSYFLARVVQSFITAAHAILTYVVCKKIFGPRAARLSALFIMGYVPLVLYTVGLLTENLFIPVLLGALYLLLKAREGRPRLYSALAGIVLGYAILIRPSLTFFIPFLGLWFYFPERNVKRAAIQFGIIAMIIVVMVTPWSIRNYRVTDQFVYLDTRTGYNLYIGYREGADGSFNMDAAIEMAELLIQKVEDGETKSDVVMHNWGKEQALNFVREHPWKTVALVPLRFMHYWSLEHRMFIFAYSYNYIGAVPPVVLCIILAALVSPFAVLVLFSIVACIYSGRGKPGPGLLLLLIGYNTLLHCLVFGEARLHFPMVPLLAILAAQGMMLAPGVLFNLRSEDSALRRSTRRRALLGAGIATVFAGIWVFGIIYSLPNLAIALAPGGNEAQLPY